jgi:DNA-binding SARP family transcriptional activator
MLQLRLLGAPAILDNAHELYLPSQKAQALLFYLAAEHQRSFARGQLITLLWEESSDREGRNSLSTVLTRLRQSLPVFPLRAEGDTLAWQPLPDIWVDLHEFQQASLGVPKAGSSEAYIQQLEAAAGLYRGTFLDGFGVRDSEGYEEWLRIERERWMQRWLNVLDQLVEAYTGAGEWDRAIGHARQALADDSLQERFHRALMRLHYFAGDRAAALSQFRICRDVLERELGVEPDTETAVLYQSIAEGQLERPALRAPLASRLVGAVATRQVNGAAPRLGARLAAARRRSFVGRTAELSLFTEALRADSPPFAVLYVYGPGGVGKSSLLSEFARLCEESGVPALALDGRNIQPTPDGFLTALREKAGIADPLAALPDHHVLLVDTYEALTPLDSWLRDQFLPQIPARAIAVLAGRSAPAAVWRVDPGWQAITRMIQLDNLAEPEANDYLERRGVPTEQRDSVLRFTRGYPLALSLAAEVLLQRPGRGEPGRDAGTSASPLLKMGEGAAPLLGAAAPDVVRVLLERFAASAPSVAHRAALEACSQVRVMTEPLLAAMLDVHEAHELFEWLRDLSFVSSGPRGLFLHDMARDALAADLKWRNPPWHLELHRRAHDFYIAEFERTSGQAQHITLLDLIFLHDNPLIRSIFTWNDMGGIREDTPRASDWPTLIEMVQRHEGAESARIAEQWFARQPEGVSVYRDSSGAVAGFTAVVRLYKADPELIELDPCAAAAWGYLQQQLPLEAGQFAAIFRFWMDRNSYQGISPTQGLIFAATIRFILTTPGLAYSFHTVGAPDLWRPMIQHVYLHSLEEEAFEVGGRRYGVFMHDWRTQPPQAWLDEMTAHEAEG